jgi:hypothetical protein
MLQNFLIVLAVLIVLGGLLALGFAVRPRPFRPHPAPSQPGAPRPLPADLPAPLLRHLRETAGAQPPAAASAVIWGRGRIEIRGVWLPLRYKLWYRAGQGFYRRMEITWFQRPVLRGVEYFIGGEGVVEVGGRALRGPRIDQAQALALWAELVFLPGALADPPGARWEAVDEVTARLVFYAAGAPDSLLAHFDPDSGRMTHLSGLRYPVPGLGSERDPDLALAEKQPWRVDLLTWQQVGDLQIPCRVAVAAGDSGSPESYWSAEGVAYNVNVSDQLGD